MNFDINKLHAAIDEWSMDIPYEDVQIVIPNNNSKERTHLGLSMLGDICQKKVFLDYRKVAKKSFPPRILRLFQRGHREEYFFEIVLRGVGLTVYSVDPETKKQFKVKDFEEHLQGSMDGLCRDKKKRFVDVDKPFLPEYKSYNDSRFKKLKKEGVRSSDPKYYTQIQGYMGYESRIKGCLFCAVNKNDDEYHFEWIRPDATTLELIKERAEVIINSKTPPAGIANRKSDWRCTYCDFKDNCHDQIESLKSCRSCIHASPALKGKWECDLGKPYGNLCKKWEDCNQ